MTLSGRKANMRPVRDNSERLPPHSAAGGDRPRTSGLPAGASPAAFWTADRSCNVKYAGATRTNIAMISPPFTAMLHERSSDFRCLLRRAALRSSHATIGHQPGQLGPRQVVQVPANVGVLDITPSYPAIHSIGERENPQSFF